MRTSFTITYKRWDSMKQRCRNKRYVHYAGKGIKICERWMVFGNFLKDMGECPPGMTLDRIDNNGNYEPGNCRWATHRQQTRNYSRNRLLTYNGQTKCVVEWSEERGVRQDLIHCRLGRGWSIEDAITYPVRGHGVKVTYRKQN